MDQIPKKVHYCWFGRNPMPADVQKCLESWKNELSEYELILWNEDNFDITTNQFVYEAYKSKKYAYVTDYVRLYALYHYGGIYMDTDVEVVRDFEPFLKHKAFTSFENENSIPTGTMAACKGNEWIKILLNYYNDKKFILDYGNLYNIPNTKTITDLTVEKYGIEMNNEFQIIGDDVHIYPSDYFCAKDWRTGIVTKTSNTCTIHHFMGSWVSKKDKISGMLIYKCKQFVKGILSKDEKNISNQ